MRSPISVNNPPIFLEQRADHHADELRRFFQAVVGDVPGVFGPGELAVSQHSSPNMSVDVSVGRCMVQGSGPAAGGGFYFLENVGSIATVTIASASSTNPRQDLIVARIKDAAYSGTLNAASIEVLTGTAAPSPVDPTIPDNCLLLARVAVAANATSISNGNITDLRSRTGAGLSGPMTAWTPTFGGGFTGGGSPPSDYRAAYKLVGNLCFVRFDALIGGSLINSSNGSTVSLPPGIVPKAYTVTDFSGTGTVYQELPAISLGGYVGTVRVHPTNGFCIYGSTSPSNFSFSGWFEVQ